MKRTALAALMCVPCLVGAGVLKSKPTSLTVAKAPPPPPGGIYPAKIAEASMPTWRKGQQIGEWRQINGTSLTSVEPRPMPAGYASSKIEAWTGLALDIRNGTVYSAANGGHGDYAGNEVNKISLQDDMPKWLEVSAPSPASSVLQNVEYYADGKPTSRHSYYSHIYIEQRNRVMHFGVGARYGNGYSGKSVDGFNSLTNMWDPAGTYPSIPNSNGGYIIGDARAEDPATGDVYIFGEYTLIRWNQSSNTYTTLLSNQATLGYYASASFDTKRNRILLRGGANGTKAYIYDVGTSKLSAVIFSGAAAAEAQQGDSEGLTYEPTLDCYLLRKSTAGGSVIRIAADTLTATILSTNGGDTLPTPTNGVYTRFQYVPTLGGVFYYSNYRANIWFLRTN